mgnify:CR=1 FL=1
MVYYDNSTNITNVVNVKDNINDEEELEKIFRVITFSLIISAAIGIAIIHVRNIYKQSILVFPLEMPHDLPAPRRTSRFFRDDYTDNNYFNRTPLEWYELENRLSDNNEALSSQ